MLDFDELKETVSNIIYEKPLLARITALLLLLFLAAIMILYVQSSKPKSKIQYEKNTIILDSKPLIPEEPQVAKEYYPSRNTENSWSEEEIKTYFTEPDQKLLKELELTNDRIISEITGAAP